MDPEDFNSEEEVNEIENQATVSNESITPEAVTTTYIYTPGGSMYYVPIVDNRLLPVIGTRFKTLEDCIDMYKRYASSGGFDVLKSTQKKSKSGLVKDRYLWCNRSGVTKTVNVDTLNKEETVKPVRKNNFTKTGCRAHVRFLWIYGTSDFTLSVFQDKHNHELLPPEYMHLSKKNRQLKYAEQLFIFNASNANIGPTKAHELYSNIKGCEQNVNGTVDDFRNWKRDMNVYINESDSQMLINKMEERKKYVPGFSFEYKIEDSQLHSIFWADEVSKCNYNEFSDVVSFDATYRTNRYNLMFVPFTGIDNHRRCVTFGAGLIRDETVETYTWLLKSFMATFGKEPVMIVTDQDQSMRKAIEIVFKTAKHRLCMWHITQKLPVKIHEANPCIEEESEKDFKSRFDKIVWNMYIEPTEFEDKWAKLMNDFFLNNDRWFKHMFEIRSTWIPAYFIETEMFGLMRTTSRSESENMFFANFMKQGSNLINFMGSFESAMLKQRSKQEGLDATTIKTTRKLCTKLKIEKHAARVYTHTIFEIIQKEIDAAVYKCSLNKMTTEEECQISLTDEALDKNNKEGEAHVIQYKVLHNRLDGSIVCSCRHYLRFGILCRHCFWVLKNCNIDEIPKQYVMRRWKSGIIPPELRSRRNRYGNENVGVQKMFNEITSVIDDCMHLLSTDEKKLEAFLEKVKALKIEVEADVKNPPSKKKEDIIQKMIGVSKPDTIEIHNPPVGKYKGCGRDKRLMSGKEIGIKESNKRKIGCSKCGGSNHNKMTCEKQEIKKQKMNSSMNSETHVI